MDRVVIEFAADTAGLEPAIVALSKLGLISDEELASFRASNDEFKKRQQIIQQTQGPMDRLAASSKNATTNLANGATNKIIEDLKKQVTDLTSKVNELEKSTSSNGSKSSNVFKQMRREYNDLVAAAEEAYKANNKALGDEIIAKAGQLQDRIGDLRATTKAYASDTAALDSIASGITAIGAGFQIAQGAQVLFGKGHEDLNKTLVKVQATMALVNGLTTIQNALQKESALRIGITNVLRFTENALARVGIVFKTQEVVVKQADNAAGTAAEVITKRVVVAKAIENGLTSQSVVVRWLATAAQWALNAAMSANPIGLLILAIAAIIGAFALFSDSAEQAAERQANLNKLQLLGLETAQAYADAVKAAGKDREAQLAAEVERLKASRATTAEIRAAEEKLAKERSANASYQAGYYANEIANIEANRKAVADLTAQINELNSKKIQEDTDNYDKQIAAVQSKIDLTKKSLELGQQAQADQLQASEDYKNKLIADQKTVEDEGLRSRRASIEAKLKFAKEGSESQYALSKALAQAEYALEIHNSELTAGEKEKIYADYVMKIRQIDEDYAKKKLQDQLSATNAQLAGTVKGSRAEFDLKIKALELQRSIELTNMKLTEDQKLEIIATSQRKINDLTTDFLRKQTLDQLNAARLRNEAVLTITQKGSADELKLKQDNLLVQQEIELQSIDKDIRDTELGQAIRNAILAKYLQAGIDLTKDYADAIIQIRANEMQMNSDYLQRMADIEARSINTTFERRQQIERDKFAFKAQQIASEKDIEKQRYNEGVITFEEYQRRLTAITLEENVNRAELEETIRQQRQEALERDVQKSYEIYSQGLKLIGDAEKVVSDNRIQGYENELAALQDQKDQQIITEAEYNARKAVLDQKIKAEKTEAAKKEREFAVLQILLETQVAAIKALGTPPAPNFLLFGVTEGFGLAQAGIAAARKIPQFAKGTEYAPPGWAWVGEKGPELIWLRSGDKIRSHEESVRMSTPALNLPSLKDSVVTRIESMPQLNEKALEQMLILNGDGVSIDYNRLASLVGKEFHGALQQLPLTQFSFDRDGFRASLHEGQSATHFLNDRYSSQ